MKKLLVAVLLVTLLFAMSGCGPTTTSEDPATSSGTESQDNADTTTNSASEANDSTITSRELMQNVNARKAFAHGFDKTYITEVILGNGSKPANYFVPVGLAVDDNGVDFRSKYPEGWSNFDPTLAAEYWNKAKEELGFTTVELELLTYDSENSKKLSEYIQGQLQQNLEGLTITLNQQPFKNKLEIANKGEFDFEFAGWAPDYPDSMTFLDMWVSGGGHNTAGYSSATYDENIERAKYGDLTTDLAARTEILQETERILIEDDCVLVPLYQVGVSYLQSPNVEGIITHAYATESTYMHATTTVDTDGKKIIRLLDGSDIPSMDTNKATNTVSFNAMGNVLEGLVTLGEGDVVEPAGATEWTVSDDGLEYVFKLRQDAVWSNGDPVTAHDYVYSWQRLANPDTASQYQFMINTSQLKNWEAVTAGEAPVTELGVEAIDDYTLKATLETPVPYFLKLMYFANFYPVNEKFVTEHATDFGTSKETTLYNGPYVISQWEIGYGYAFEKNPTYWNASNVKNDGVSFRIVKDASAGVNLYETGEVDRAGLSGEFVEQFIDHPDFKTRDNTQLMYLVFNINNQGEGQH